MITYLSIFATGVGIAGGGSLLISGHQELAFLVFGLAAINALFAIRDFCRGP